MHSLGSLFVQLLSPLLEVLLALSLGHVVWNDRALYIYISFLSFSHLTVPNLWCVTYL